MRCRLQLSGAVVAAIGAGVLAIGCSQTLDVAKPSAEESDTAQRESTKQAVGLATAARAVLGHSYLCALLAPSGARVMLLVTTEGAREDAIRLLRKTNVTARVAVSSIAKYTSEEVVIARKIRHAERSQFHGTDVSTELFSRELLCPKVYIEVGVRGHVSHALLRWAQGVVMQFGSDRVGYRYYGKLNFGPVLIPKPQ
jgi:hypothetical protein